jgi:Haem-binding domain
MTLKWIALPTLAALLGAMQFVGPACLNPVSQDRDELEADQDVPAGIAKLLERSCMDCHSNHTHWAWYSQVAPVSWYIHHHIEEGRKKMNFSEWSSRRDSAGRVIHSINDLEAVCDAVSKGTMPFLSYTLLHRSAVLSPGEKEAICDWTDRLVSERHAPARPGGDTK